VAPIAIVAACSPSGAIAPAFRSSLPSTGAVATAQSTSPVQGFSSVASTGFTSPASAPSSPAAADDSSNSTHMSAFKALLSQTKTATPAAPAAASSAAGDSSLALAGFPLQLLNPRDVRV